MNLLKKEKKTYIILALMIIAVWVATYFSLGEQAHMRILDNLD